MSHGSVTSSFPAAVLTVFSGASTFSLQGHSALLVHSQNRENHDLTHEHDRRRVASCSRVSSRIHSIQSAIYELDVFADAATRVASSPCTTCRASLPRVSLAYTRSSRAWSQVRPLLLAHAFTGGRF